MCLCHDPGAARRVAFILENGWPIPSVGDYVDSDAELHVIPEHDDEPMHIPDEICWCYPEVKSNGVVVHRRTV